MDKKQQQQQQKAYLRTKCINMISIDMCITDRMNKFTSFQTTNVCNYMCQ